MKKVLTEAQFEQIMQDSTMIATRVYAEHNKLGFGTELMLVSYSAWLTGVVRDRLFKEVSSK